MFVVGMYMREFEILHNNINFKITIIAFISLALIVFLWRIFFLSKIYQERNLQNMCLWKVKEVAHLDNFVSKNNLPDSSLGWFFVHGCISMNFWPEIWQCRKWSV